MDIDLKEVFALLAENNQEQIQLRHFVDVANNYYSDAEVSEQLFDGKNDRGNLKPFDSNCEQREKKHA